MSARTARSDPTETSMRRSWHRVTASPRKRPEIRGNRMVLVGAVLYLLEWVAIIAAPVNAPLGAGLSGSELGPSYLGRADALGWAAGWFSVLLLGRVFVMTGLRTAMAASGRPQPLMDLAVGAMVVDVALEISAYAVVAGAAWSLDEGGPSAVTRGLDAVAFQESTMLYGSLGVSLLCAAAAMWRSELFGRGLSALGGLTGLTLTGIGVSLGAPRFSGAADSLSNVALLFWVWMLWTGVVVWRGRAHRGRAHHGARSSNGTDADVPTD